MRAIVIWVFCAIIIAYGVSLARPAFFLKTQGNHQKALEVPRVLGPPIRQTVSIDQTQTDFVYRVGDLKPLCVDYTLTFNNSTGDLTSWTWEFCD